MIFLTRRDDLRVQSLTDDLGMNYLVSILANGHVTSRMFGVVLKAAARTTVLQPRNGEYRIPIDIQDPSIYTSSPFPICLLYFTMQDDRGYWRWLMEPVIDNPIPGQLKLNTNPAMKALTNEQLDSIVEALNKWYDNRIPILAAS